MATPKPVKLDHVGIADILKSAAMKRAVQLKTDQVKRNVERQGITVGAFKGDKGEIRLPVTAKVIETDRAHGIVSLAHPAGEAVQAKYGALTKAAAQAGLDVDR